ncbi:MAG: hypothetical protein VXZ59_05940 [Cyanobacteriota bacterium]|nr:hypothetical protein [Cyanobacteriota bacterium]
MRIRTELCHVDTLRCVVRAEAWDNHQCIGSCLGEASTAEEAEDRARARLHNLMTQAVSATAAATEPRPNRPILAASQLSTETSRPVEARQSIEQQTPMEQSRPASGTDSAEPQSIIAVPETAQPPSESPTDPEDWSEELTAIDLELKRIGWDREQERKYLERAFGHASRHRLTRYADLVAYLRQLRQLQQGDQPDQSSVPIRRSDLITQGDAMLKHLNWSGDRARAFLNQHLQANSRQQLTDEQLLQFNVLLEDQCSAMSLG